MTKDRISMPSSQGGLVRYFDEYKSKISFKPGHVIILALLVVLIIALLHMQGNSWLGMS